MLTRKVLVLSNDSGGRSGAATSTASGTSAGRRTKSAAPAAKASPPRATAAAPDAPLRRSSGPPPRAHASPSSAAPSSTSPPSRAIRAARPRASSTRMAPSAPSREHRRRDRAHEIRPRPARPPHQPGERQAVLPEVEVAVAVELHYPPPHRGAVAAELVVVNRPGIHGEQDSPAGVAQALAEVRLVRVHEEVAVEPAHLLGRLAPHEHRARLHPAHLAHACAGALDRHALVHEDRRGERPLDVWKPPGARGGLTAAREELRARRGGARVGVKRVEQRPGRALAQLRVLVQQEAVVPARLLQEQRVVVGLAGSALEREQPRVRVALAHRIRRAVGGGVVEHDQLVVHADRVGPLDRGEAVEQELAPVRVHHAVSELGQRAASSSTASARAASSSRANWRSASARALRPIRSATSGLSRSQASLSASSSASPGRTYAPASFRSTSSRIQPSMFTMAGRPAANVSNSLLGELVASTGTSLKSVRQALDPAASFATSSFVPLRNSTFGGALRSKAARRLPSPMITKRMSGSSRAASTAAVTSLASLSVPK